MLLPPFLAQLVIQFVVVSVLFPTVSAIKAVVHDSSFQPSYVLRVTAETTTVNCQKRYSTLVNGTSPGPALYLKEGQTTWIRVYNDAKDVNTTIHWHGLSQRTAPFSDGVPLLSQWPIPPGNFFDYEIHPDVGDAGTYFFHSHVGFQSVSAHGALIVEEANGKPPYKYDDDIILALGDYFEKTDKEAEADLLSSPFVWPGEPKALLVNGKSGQKPGSKDASCALEVIKVKPGMTYRLRFIGATALTHYTLGIENHEDLPIIEADGHYTKPYKVDRVQVAPGQRFSILFTAKTSEELKAANKSVFWVQLENRAAQSTIRAYAQLQYDIPASQQLKGSVAFGKDGLPRQPVLTLPARYNDWVENALLALNPSAYPFPNAAQVTRTVVINVLDYIQGAFTPPLGFTGTDTYQQNGNSFTDTKVQSPYLVNIYKYGEAAIPDYAAAMKNGGWDPKTYAFPAKVGEVVDIVWQGLIGKSGRWESHPFHAHGGHYFDLGGGPGNWTAAAMEKNIKGYTPVLRDTTLVYAYVDNQGNYTAAGWRAWRLKVDNAGVWMMHCHILQHMIMGMQTVWVMGNASEIVGKDPKPYVAGYLDYGGSAYGNSSADPFVAHHFAE